MSKYKTSWSTSHLQQLKELVNHKLEFDGFEYVWMVKLDHVWVRHYITNFDNYNKPFSWIQFTIHGWGMEYNQRIKDYLKDMSKSLDIDLKIKEISLDYDTRTKEKVKEILLLKPKLSAKEISCILGTSIRTIERHVKN